MTLGVEVENLLLRYGSTNALNGLTFTLAGGKIYGLLGRNGSGKTSLLSVLAAFRKASGGTVRIGGQYVFENPRITRRICLIRESGDTGDRSDKVKETLDIARSLRPSWDAGYAAKLVDMFSLPLDKKVGSLSRGQRSALGITIGLASRAPLTIFDESHLGMDVPSRGAFQDELLADFIAHPRTIIISTHLIEEMSSLFEDVLIIDRGRLLLHEEVDVLRSRGASVTGPAELVDQFAEGFVRLGEKQLGRTKSATVYGSLDDAWRQQARDAGLDLGPVALAELFTHFTQREEYPDE